MFRMTCHRGMFVVTLSAILALTLTAPAAAVDPTAWTKALSWLAGGLSASPQNAIPKLERVTRSVYPPTLATGRGNLPAAQPKAPLKNQSGKAGYGIDPSGGAGLH